MTQATRPTINIMIVDDHLLVRDGLELLVSTFDNIWVVGKAEDGAQAVTLAAELQPDVILMDIMMPEMDGPTATAQIRATQPQIQIVALTSFVDEELIKQAIKAGAIAYLLKNASAEQLIQAIEAASEGKPTLDPIATQVLMQNTYNPTRPGHDLTDRERTVLVLLVDGRTNKEIAEALTLSPGTVRVYVSNILTKLNATNRTEAAALARKYGLVDSNHAPG
jgi:NarL family two-component system response regulator LiaR